MELFQYYIFLWYNCCIFVLYKQHLQMKQTTIKKLVDVILIYCTVNGLTVSPLKLQKLLYYIQAWHIAKFEKKQLFDDLPQAWVNGPVYRSVYNMFKDSFFRNESLHPIVDGNAEIELSKKIKALKLEEEQVNLINSVLKFYAPKDDGTLVLKTHTDSPWNEAREGLGSFDRSTNTISVDSMFDFYGKMLA